MNPALNSSVKMDWMTPDSLLELVRTFNEGKNIGLDPCTVWANPTGANTFAPHDLGHDGLSVSWLGFGLVYVNPPYGRELAKWVNKCVVEAAHGAEIILLTPARPDTRWFQNAISLYAHTPTVLFWRGRLKFKGAPASAPFPSALFYWGPRRERFREVFAGKGLFL